jgi:excisionase family DNA binding protein
MPTWVQGMNDAPLPQPATLWQPGKPGPLEEALARPSLSTRQVANILGLSERSVRRAIVTGALEAERAGTTYRIRPLDVHRWAAQRRADTRSSVVAPPSTPAFDGLPQAPLSPFIGRARELHEVLELLGQPGERLLTLTGPGGAGKTRLAIELAGLMQTRLRDGVHLVQLESVRDPALLPSAIAQGLGLDELATGSMTSLVVQALRTRQVLLILDNFEQILPAAPELTQVLAGAPDVQILVTSRAPLRITGERLVTLPPMSLPAGTVTPEELLACDASRLFLERAERQAPLPELDDDLARTVAEICARVDALPLGIELAAAMTRVFTLPQLLERLERRLPLLHNGPRDAPTRHGTMRNAIAWSYDLLTPQEQALFCHLSVFVGGFTLDAVEMLSQGIAPGSAAPAPGQLLASLVDHSLVRRIAGRDGAARYVMLETIREFGQEQLAASGAEGGANTAHARYFLGLLRQILPLASVYGAREPLERLAAEQGNLRQALTWLQAHGTPAEFVELVAALGLAWYPYRANREGQPWLEAALALNAGDPLHRAQLLIGYGGVRFAQGTQAGISAMLEDADDHLAVVDAPIERALLAILRGAMANREGDFAAAARHLDCARELAAHIPDPILRAAMTGRTLRNSAVTSRGQEELETTLRLLEDALQHYAAADFDLAESILMVTQGEVLLASGDFAGALATWHRALRTADMLGDPRVVADTFALAAIAAAASGEHSAALLLLGATAAMRERESTTSSLQNAASEQAALDASRQALGLERADQLLAAGRVSSMSEVVDLVGQLSERLRPRTRPLTRRQREVLRLLASGQTDQEIADALFLSRRTVSWHVRAILEHFRATTRDEAITRARSDGLLPQ